MAEEFVDFGFSAVTADEYEKDQTDGLDHSIKDYLDILYNHSECDAKCRGSQEIRD